MQILQTRRIVSYLSLLFLFACNQSSSHSETSNQTSPFKSDIQLSLVHEWSLNNIDQFPNLTYFQATDDGNLIVGDYALPKIYLLDKAGNILKSFAGKGRGPGELNNLSAMATHTDGQIATADMTNRIINIFNINHESIQTTDFVPGWNTSIQWIENRLFIVNKPFDLRSRNIPSGSLIIRAFDPESEKIEELMVLELELQDAPPDQITCSFCPLVFIDKNYFFTFDRDTTYQFHKVDIRTGEHETFTFSGISELVEYTKSEHESIIENRKKSSERTGVELPEITLPIYKNRFSKLFIDTEKRVWLQLAAHQDSTSHFDVFSEKGNYLGSVDFPENATSAEHFSENGILFRFPSNDPNVYSVKLYSID